MLAYEVLRGVDERDAYANLLLPALLHARGLEGRDAAFATELTYGTLRSLGTYDTVLAVSVDRPLASLDPPLLDVLRLGAHQVLALRVPAHAAVSASVELAREVLGEGRARLVNAVLRRVAQRGLDSWLAELAPLEADDPVGRLALLHAHPRWVVEAFRDALGGDLAETARLLEADNTRPAVTLAVRPGLGGREELLAGGAMPARWSPYGAYLAGGDPGALPTVRDGRAGVQDEGSQLVALALASAPLAGPDRRWLDLCAGPGGKSALLAGLAGERGGRLLANELQPHRARLVASTVGGAADVVVGDGTRPAWHRASFDRVMVDAPCTGLGALRRRPESRWRRSPEDVERLGPLQRALLRGALDSARSGGLVAYVTCSPHLAETRTVVADVLGERPDVTQLDARAALPEMPALGDGPDVQLWPHRHGTDAMYLALLQS